MRYSDDFLDEIRARLPVSEVVRQRVPLKKQGREWRGLSPFNKEKTPSFFVNDQKGFYHDFSSGKSGDQFKFLMETEGVTFPEAVERLARMAGVPIPAVSKEAEKEEQKRKTLYDVMDLAANFSNNSLRLRGERRRGTTQLIAASPLKQSKNFISDSHRMIALLLKSFWGAKASL